MAIQCTRLIQNSNCFQIKLKVPKFLEITCTDGQWFEKWTAFSLTKF